MYLALIRIKNKKNAEKNAFSRKIISNDIAKKEKEYAFILLMKKREIACCAISMSVRKMIKCIERGLVNQPENGSSDTGGWCE